MARQYAAQFSKELSEIEYNVDEIEANIIRTIDFDRIKSDPAYITEYENKLDKYLFTFAKDRSKSKSAWCYFNPELSSNPHDVYYVDEDQDKIPERQAYIPFSYYDGKPQADDDKQWWYGAVESKKGFWTNPYKWVLDNGTTIDVVSYAKPIFHENKLIAVVGTYFYFSDMQSEILNIDVYNSGFASLLNDKLDFIVHPVFKTGNRFNSENLAEVRDGKYKELASAMITGKYGIETYDMDGREQLLAYSKLSNGWTLAIIPKSKELYEKVNSLTNQMTVVIIISMLVSIVAAYFVSMGITKSMRKVIQGANQISSGDLDVYIDVDSNDEVKLVADSLNHMVSNTKKLQSELKNLAYYDELTGIPNKNLFKVMAMNLIMKRENHYAYVIFDINKFKMVNDIFGYVYGDSLLKFIARTLYDEFSIDETVARYNGDIFHIMCKFDSKSQLESRLMAISKRISDFEYAENAYDHISVCFGVYVIDNPEGKIEYMGDKADFALKKIKGSYTTAIYFFNEELRNKIIEEHEIETDMQQALDDGEFIFYLQPKYSLENVEVEGVEALVRWSHRSKGLISPDDFIPIFEKNGFIVRLDMYILESVCQYLRKWIDLGKKPITVSVNQSRIHLHNPGYINEIVKILNKYHIPPHLIEVELTESAFFEDAEKMVEVVNKLHELKFKIAMDDFGSGYSSLNMLQDIAVDVLKIDKKFFNYSSMNDRGKKIVNSIISMASDLDVTVVAEGVETKEQVEFLKQTDCHLVQGYYFSVPVPVDSFEKNYYNM